GRAFDQLGDTEASARVLEGRVSLGSRSSRPPADAELFYRLAEARLATAETRAQGLSLLERAIELRFDPEHAERLLAIDLGSEENEPRTAYLRERIARASGDALGLVRALAQRAALKDADIAGVREGLELAKQLAEPELLEKLAEAALGNRKLELSPEDAGWLRLELAEAREARGDLEGALELRERAAHDLPPNEGRALLLGVASRAEERGELERAAAVYARILKDDPSEPRALTPLLDLYGRLGKQKEWLGLVEHAIGVVESVSERSTLRIAQARALMGKAKGDARAIDVLRDLLLDEPSRPDAVELLATLLEKASRHDELAELLSSELDGAFERRDDAAVTNVALKLMGALERAGRLEDALEAGRRALEVQPENAEIARTMLRLAEASGDAERTADALERVLSTERGPDAAALAQKLVALREKLGDEAGAERALELACIASPGDVELLEGLVSRLEIRGEQGRAARLIARALEERPGDRRLLERLAQTYLAAGDSELALGALDGLLELDPENVGYLQSRAAAFRELGREHDALNDLERAYANEPSLAQELVQALEQAAARAEPPEDGELAIRLVNVLESTGDLVAARARLAEFLSHKPEDLAGFRRLASLDQRLGNAEEALVTLERLAALETGSGLVEVALGLHEAAAKAGRLEIARPALERALELDPEHAEVRTRLEALYSEMQAFRELSELLLQRAAVAPEPNERLELVLRAAEALLQPNGDVETAIRVLEVARSETPASIEAALLLARAYAAADQPQRGIEVLTTVAQANRGKRTPKLAAVYEQIANIHLGEGFMTDALDALSKAFESDSKNAKLAMDLGRLALDCEQAEIAQRAFRAVTIMRPPGPEGGGAEPEEKAEANYQLAALSKRQGDVRKARVLVSKALADSPAHELARALLAELDQK
ncbi:MAG TPA: tetratricopeptide repeat protein, partial [Polyangiaceae bacterium]